MKKSKNLARIKLKIQKFFMYELWQILIVISAISLFAWLFRKPIEAVFFCISHVVIRYCFAKEYHSHYISICMCITLFVIFLGTTASLPLAVSIISSVPVAFLICWVGYIAQDRVDLLLEVKRLNNHVDELMKNISHKDIYSMNEDELYEHCRNCGLNEEDCKIAYLVVIERLRGKELYTTINYSERHAKRKRKQILDKIK